MTIKTYLEKVSRIKATPADNQAPPIMEAIMQETDVWSGDAAMGYAASAAVALGLDHGQVVKLLDAMQAAQENMTIEEAEQVYLSGDY